MRFEAGFELVQNDEAELLRILFLVPRQEIRSSAETVSRSKSTPRGSRSPMMMALDVHERHAIHPGFLDGGVVASAVHCLREGFAKESMIQLSRVSFRKRLLFSKTAFC